MTSFIKYINISKLILAALLLSSLYSLGADCTGVSAWSGGSQSPGQYRTYNNRLYYNNSSWWDSNSSNPSVNNKWADQGACSSDPDITASSGATIAGSAAVNIQATVSNSGSVEWYAASSGGTSIGSSASGANFSVGTVSSTTTYYAQAVKSGVDYGSRVAVTVTIATVTAHNDQHAQNFAVNECSSGIVKVYFYQNYQWQKLYMHIKLGGTTLYSLGYTVSGNSFSWRSGSGNHLQRGGALNKNWYAKVNTVNKTIEVLDNDDFTCSSCTDPTVSGYTAGSRCGTGAVSIVGTASAGSIKWYSASSGGTLIGSSSSGASFSTPSISSTTTYYAEAVDGSCNSSSRQAVVATVNALPTVSGYTAGSRCGTGAVSIVGTASAGSIKWYSASSGGTLIGSSSSGASFSTPSISSTTTYYAEAVNGSCNSSSRQAVVATVNAIPTILSSVKGARVGTGAVAVSAAASAGTVKWYAAANGGGALATNNSYTTGSISSTTNYYAEADDGTCTSSARTEVKALIYATAPGGVASNLLLWLKADAQANKSGTTLATDGERVDNWKDQSYNDLDADDSGGNGPVWDADGINGNPALDFTGSGSGNPLDIPNGIMQNETKANMYVYAVCATDLNQWNALFWQDLNTGNTNEVFSFIPRGADGDAYWDNGNTGGSDGRLIITSPDADLGKSYLYSLKSTSNAMEVKRDGVSLGSNSNTGSSTADHITPFYIGYRWDNQNTYFDGKLAELIILDGIPTAAQEDQIESYLSIKYGIGVGTTTDVKNSAGTVVWDKTTNSSYNNDIIGIGRDDNSGLDQKSSQAINSSDVLKISTLSNAQTGANNTFEIWGNNNGSVAVQADNSGTSHNGKVFNQTIARKWLIQETGTVGAVKIEIDLTNSSFSSPAAQKMALVFDNDGGFNGSADESFTIANTYNSGTKILTFNSVDLADGKYVTLMKSASVLPVELLSFTTVSAGDVVILNWKTASEINNDYFAIEKSMDGINWDFVIQIPGAGNSDNQLSYTHIDYEGCQGYCYYRLTQVDFDGAQKAYKSAVVNNEAEAAYNILVTPNPIKTVAHVTCQFPEDGIYNFSIISITGQTVYKAKIMGVKGYNNFNCPTEQHLPGIYYYTIRDANGNIAQQKALKN